MKTYLPIKDLCENKDVLIAFSDPGGSKSVLSFAQIHRYLFKSIIAISDRVHDFYDSFDLDVEEYGTQTPDQWLKNVDVLVTGTSYPHKLEIQLIRYARGAGITSLSFIDHWMNMAKRFQTEEGLILPDWICVLDGRACHMAIEDGIPENKLIVTGNPYHDFLRFWQPSCSRKSFLRGIGLPHDARYVLYAPEPLSIFELDKKYGFNELDGLNMIIEAAALWNTNKYIVLKAHPNQHHDLFTDYLSKLTDINIIYLKEGDMPALIYNSDCVLGFFSSSLVDAMVMGKKVIRPLMKLKNVADDILVGMDGPNFISLRDGDQFANAVQKIFSEHS